MDSILARALLVVGLALVVLPFLVFAYRPLAIFSVGEFWTNIIRRNKIVFLPAVFAPIGVLAWWGIHYRLGSWDWPWGEFYGTVVLLYGVLVGHFYWAGLRPGAIHRPTAWRCVEELRQNDMAPAADYLKAQLEAKGHEFEAPDRHGNPRPL